MHDCTEQGGNLNRKLAGESAFEVYRFQSNNPWHETELVVLRIAEAFVVRKT